MPKKYAIKTRLKTILADVVTPVSIYLRLRARVPGTLLLEGSDYHSAEDSFSYILCSKIASVVINQGELSYELPDGSKSSAKVKGKTVIADALRDFMSQFEVDQSTVPPGVINGLFGYFTYDAVQFAEEIDLTAKPFPGEEIPDLRYSIFRYVLAINHFKNEMYILENICEGDTISDSFDIEAIACHSDFKSGEFKAIGKEASNLTDTQHQELVKKVKEHIFRGDVFQIVPSRKFSQEFEGDDFNVYRALRSLNPSPYLFYFDYGDYKIFGSSPEAQIVVKEGKASIHPIAGTYRRTGSTDLDTKAATALLNDPKETSEHVMLVDLARNDLSIHCYPVVVDKFKEVQLYSHVIHLVSKVTGTLNPGVSSLSILTSTFPAGTLSGAPKYKAMQIIDKYEGNRRHFYGGALGFIGFNGDIIHAIMIRSFLSKDRRLWMQAGSGIVADSDPETEVREVENKLAALKAAIKLAEKV